jgi:hypothetical protein
MSNLLISEINHISLETMIKLSRAEQNLIIGGVKDGCIPPFKAPIIIITPTE